jgi:cytidylate kinase
MAVIALTQGMGSLAQDIAEQLADELELSTLQHEVAERVAEKMHVSKSLINRLRTGKAGALDRLRTDRHAVAIYTAEEVLDAAARGNVVIRGWGATQLLRSVPHVPCIRVMRPFALRVQWLMKALDTDDRGLAEAEIRRSDAANASRMHEQFGVHWGDPELFDMVLNTERLSVQSCVEQIKGLLQRPEFAETETSRSRLQGLMQARHCPTGISRPHPRFHARVSRAPPAPSCWPGWAPTSSRSSGPARATPRAASCATSPAWTACTSRCSTTTSARSRSTPRRRAAWQVLDKLIARPATCWSRTSRPARWTAWASPGSTSSPSTRA